MSRGLQQWRNLLPDHLSDQPAQLNPDLVSRVAEVADDLADNSDAVLTYIAHNGPTGQCVMTWPNLPMTFALIMPCKKEPIPLPAWVYADKETQAAAE